MRHRAVVVPLTVFAVVSGRHLAPPSRLRVLDPRDAITPAVRDLGWGVDLWAQWDADWYLAIAENGYDGDSRTPAFHPALPGAGRGSRAHPRWPLRARGGRRLAGRRRQPRACCSTGSPSGTSTSRVRCRTILFVAIFPTTLFLGAVYTEALFLALAVAAFLARARGVATGRPVWWSGSRCSPAPRASRCCRRSRSSPGATMGSAPRTPGDPGRRDRRCLAARAVAPDR